MFLCADLTGVVSDPSGAVVPNASISAVASETGAAYLARTGKDGVYRLLGLHAGSYVMQASAPGFRTTQLRVTGLHEADQSTVDLSLPVGGDSVTVDVSAPLLQTITGEVSFTAGQEKVQTLPLDGRNFIPLITLAPGVALPGGGSLLARINGSRPRTNEYLYDGISALQPEPGQVVFYPIVDAIEEFRLNLNSYSPEYGRSNGGTVMVTTRSGQNQLHGTLFEYFRNEDLNARNYFAQPGAKPEFRRNQYGLTVGGPVRKNKTFFFVDWQGTRLRTGITRFSTVPTLAQRAGVFTGSIFDPATPSRTQFVNNTIPVSRFDPVALAALQHYPLPNLAGTANNYVRTAAEPDTQDQLDGRVDHYVTQQQRLFARYSWLRDKDIPVTPFPEGSGAITSGVISQTFTRGAQLVAEHEWTISPSLLNQLRFGYTRRSSTGDGPANADIGIPNTPSNSFASALPLLSVAGYQQIGASAGANSRFVTSVTEYVDTFSAVKGKHTLKFGADLRREALDVVQPANPTGSYTFNTTGTNNSSVTGSGNAFASFLLGQVSAFTIDVQTRPLQERAHIAEFFASDEWRINSRLSINYGTRYTLNFPSTEVSGQGAVFNLQTQVLDFPRRARNVECCDFGPRAGIAWQPAKNTVVRSGYGLVYFEQTGVTTPFTLPQFPFVQTLTRTTQDNVNAAFTLQNGPGVVVQPPDANSGLGQGVFSTDRTLGSGYSQQWNFTVQHTFGQNWNLEAGYVGSKNTHLGLPEANLNQLPAEDLAMGSALLTRVTNPYYGLLPASSSLNTPTIARQQLLRAFPRFTTAALFRNNVGDSEYESAQARLERRFAHGLTINFAYTFSKLIDDASSYFSQTIFTGPVLNASGAADAFNRRLERDLSSGDIPRVFSAGWVYEIPRWKKIGGWQIAGLVRIQSGDTVPISQATNSNSSLGYAVQRPNRISDPNSYDARSASRWFDTAAFTLAPQFTIGTSSRNPIRGPGLQNADLMIGKTFRLTEQAQFEFRAEAFNVSNTPPLNDPNAVFGSAAFGSITSAGNPRDFEFAGRLRF